MNIIIKKLHLYTENLKEQKNFYTEVLVCPLLSSAENQFSVQVGKSVLTFEKRISVSTPYHFAINIPSFQEEEALVWLKERLSILKNGKEEIIDFPAWNAKAIYFYDADKNIVELIARKNLNLTSDATFSINALLEISEIGIPTDDISSIFDFLHHNLGLNRYSGNFERFCAIGEETALFIVIHKEIKKWFPTMEEAYPEAFKITISKSAKDYQLQFQDNNLVMVKE